MIYKATKAITDNYFAHVGISQSQIKLYMKGFDFYQQNVGIPESEKYFDEPKEHFIIGAAVDMMLTHEESDFTDTYYISTLESKPTDAEISVIRMVYDKITEHNRFITEYTTDIDNITELLSFGDLIDHKQLLTDSISEQGYRSTYGMPARMKYFETDICAKYWHELIYASNKQIITSSDKILIDELVARFRDSDVTSKYFNPIRMMSNIDIIYQVPMYVNEDNTLMKGMVDMIMIYHETQQMILFDIKTMSDSASMFPADYFKRRYDIQAAYYCTLASSNNVLLDFGGRITKKMINYTVIDFRFLVASKQFPMSDPVEYSVGLDNIKDLIFGKPETSYITVDSSGNFYSQKVKRIRSVTDLAMYIRLSLEANIDARLSSNAIEIYNPI